MAGVSTQALVSLPTRRGLLGSALLEGYRKFASAGGRESWSCGSWPAMAERMMPQSSAVRAIGPSLSIDQASAIAPQRLTRPKLGRIPEMPHQDVGQMMEPR